MCYFRAVCSLNISIKHTPGAKESLIVLALALSSLHYLLNNFSVNCERLMPFP